MANEHLIVVLHQMLIRFLHLMSCDVSFAFLPPGGGVQHPVCDGTRQETRGGMSGMREAVE